MTKNQNDHKRIVEERRHNIAMERENKRSNQARERETFRANVAALEEQARSNRAREQENTRANTINMLHYQQQDEEQAKYHRNSEILTAESQAIERERIGLGYTQTANQTTVGLANVGLGYANLDELVRSNTAREAETRRSNVMNEYYSGIRAGQQEEQTAINSRTASANLLNAQTRAEEHKLNVMNWASVTVPSAMASIALNQQRAKTEESSRQRMSVQNRNDTVNTNVNAASTIFNMATQAIKTGLQAAGAMGGASYGKTN